MQVTHTRRLLGSWQSPRSSCSDWPPPPPPLSSSSLESLRTALQYALLLQVFGSFFSLVVFEGTATSIRIRRQCATGFAMNVPQRLVYLALFVLENLPTKQGIASHLSQHKRLFCLCVHFVYCLLFIVYDHRHRRFAQVPGSKRKTINGNSQRKQ